MVYLLTLGLALGIYPAKPDMSMNFTGIMVPRALALAKTFGIKIEPPMLGGKPIDVSGCRITKLRIEMRGRLVLATINGFQTHQDSAKEELLRTATMWVNRHSGDFHVKAEALGGLIELTGVLPK